MAIVHFKEALVLQPHHVCGGNGKLKIGVIDVRKHGLPGEAPLGHYRIDVALHDLGHAVAKLRQNHPLDVGGVEVNGFAFVLRRDLFALHDEELAGFLKHWGVFLQGLEAHPQGVIAFFFKIHPGWTVFFEVFVESPPALGGFGQPFPALAFLQGVVVRKGHKIVAMFFVPGHDHFGKVVSIAPQRVGVQVALVPLLGAQRADDAEKEGK